MQLGLKHINSGTKECQVFFHVLLKERKLVHRKNEERHRQKRKVLSGSKSLVAVPSLRTMAFWLLGFIDPE